MTKKEKTKALFIIDKHGQWYLVLGSLKEQTTLEDFIREDKGVGDE